MRNIKLISEILLLGAIVTTLIVLAILPRMPSKDYQFGGVLRPDEAGQWFIFGDKTHQSINLLKVVTSKNTLEVFFKTPIKKINYASVTSHRQLIEQGIFCGTSVGVQSIIISCVKCDGPVDLTTLRWPSYIWVMVQGTV